MRFIGILLSIGYLLSVCLTGCASSQTDAQRQRIAKTPPDFTLEVFVDSIRNDDADSRHVRSKYLLQPNFNLHLSLGVEASKDHYPVRFLKLRHEQFEQIVSVTHQANLMAEPTSLYAEQVINKQEPADPDRPLLYVTITRWGKTNSYVTTGTDSPPTQILLDRLILATGRKLPDGDIDSHRGY